MSSAAINEVQLEQMSERFNLAVTIGDEELLRVIGEELSLKEASALAAENNQLLGELKQSLKSFSEQRQMEFEASEKMVMITVLLFMT